MKSKEQDKEQERQNQIYLFVKNNFAGIPQEWVKIVSEHLNADIYAWPMWGTMWIVDDFLGKKLMNNSILVCNPEDCENHDKNTRCQNCEEWEEMESARNILDKDGNSTAAYIYDIDDVWVMGIHGAGWDFYDGVWDRLYDLIMG